MAERVLRDDDDRLLSRLLFEAREVASMYADVVKAMTGKDDQWLPRLTAEIDAYREQRGWPADGFGGEV